MILFKLSISFLALILMPAKIFAQQIYSDIYKNKDYAYAVQWLNNHDYIYDSLSAYGVSPEEAIAIVFPELMRYSALEDKMEVTGLMVLYTRLGKQYADFSVGRFQMKPSFVQQLEVDARKYLTKKTIKRICPFLLNGDDTQGNRSKRVESLTSVSEETSYLTLFYKICLEKFKRIHFKSAGERIRFLATAYNCGYHHSAKNLFEQMEEKQFPVYEGLIVKHVNYAALAMVCWKKNEQENKVAVK